MTLQILQRDIPCRAIALATPSHLLIFRSSRSISEPHGLTKTVPPQIMVEFTDRKHADLPDYRLLRRPTIRGTLGLINVGADVFICVITSASEVANVRPGERVLRIAAVDFYCINRADFDELVGGDAIDDVDGPHSDHFDGVDSRGYAIEHPCTGLKKTLGDGTFYYSFDFDLTTRLQGRASEDPTPVFYAGNFDDGFMWNSYMIQPLVAFRSQLGIAATKALDDSRILTSAIRGYVSTTIISAGISPIHNPKARLPSTLSLISRLSCRRAGTRFNSRGIDDDGNVANFVETESIFWHPSGLCFSYAQIRGSVPVFWEQATGLPHQQKIQITRSAEATQPAFDKHFEGLELKYSSIHVLNLLSRTRSGEVELTNRYNTHISQCSLNRSVKHGDALEHALLRHSQYDFHAETREMGYEAAGTVRRLIQDQAEGFAYFLADQVQDNVDRPSGATPRVVPILQQEGVFRTNCLDCLDRTNLIQTIISQTALESFLTHRGEQAPSDFWLRHSTLWADNGDALSRIYAGTGALKSSFTRHGKMSLAGALADARKSAARLYINNFADRGRQAIVDTLLGRLVDQSPVKIWDPINDFVSSELSRRAHEYSTSKDISIWVGTFNLNGKGKGEGEDLSTWLCPSVYDTRAMPQVVAVGFQEIVELSPQQIMSTDPARRREWEVAVTQTLNRNAGERNSETYVLLRSSQLVGTALMIFVQASALSSIKNVEGNVKKTGLNGMAGNKGGVGIRMEFASTRLCFVTAHLAAGFANYEERNRDYQTISHGLRFQRNRSIDDHDAVIWLGDFNYRIGLSDEKVRKCIAAGDLATLYQNDQLNIQMVAGHSFQFYVEAKIRFPPTYKYQNGSDDYDISEKARIPAYCDRVLSKGHNLKQNSYNVAALRFSDHRPVYATFQCTVKVEDEKKRESLSKSIYDSRCAEIGQAMDHVQASGQKESQSMDSEFASLPVASAERKRWWLSEGFAARSNVAEEHRDYAPNPQRLSNPFLPSSEPDWVLLSQAPNHRAQHREQKYVGLSPPTQSPNAKDWSSTGSISSPTGHILRKPAPPVPEKPLMLSRFDSPADAAQLSEFSNINAPFPGPQRIEKPNRETHPALPAQPLQPSILSQAQSLSDIPPELPPRSNAIDGSSQPTLIDADDEYSARHIPALKPSRANRD